MTIIQISKIQHRTGAQSDLPQLDKGELGFATDSRRLFIGNDLDLYPQDSNETSQTEVLTEYSTILFSQIDGNGKDLIVDSGNIQNGQILRFDSTLDKWTLGGGTLEGNINLGDISNPKILGGSGGMIVETDGTGNLSWGLKSYAFTQISVATSESPVLLTTTNPHPFLNSTPVTISDIVGLCSPVSGTGTISCSTGSSIVTGVGTSFATSFIGKQLYTTSNALIGTVKTIVSATSLTLSQTSLQTLSGASFKVGNSGLNGNTYYAKVQTENTFWLYSDIDLTSPVSTSGVSVNYISSGRAVGNVSPNLSGTSASGTNYSIQYAYNNVLSHSADLKYSSGGTLFAPKFSGNGFALTSLNASNVVGSVASSQTSQNANVANTASTVTSSTQGNITSVGTLTGLNVNGNVNISNSGSLITGSFLSSSVIPAFQVQGRTESRASALFANYGLTNKPAQQWFIKSRSDSISSLTGTLQAGDYIGSIIWAGANAGNLVNQGELSVKVDSVVSGVYKPKLSIKLLDSEKFSIDSVGNVLIPGNLTVQGVFTGAIQLAQKVSACSQPNITSVGTLTALNVSGVSNLDDVVISGNLLTANITSNNFVKTPDLILGDASNTVSRIAFYSDESTTPFWLTNTGSGNLRISYGITPTLDNFVKFSTNGDVNASGNINALAFVGDGSHLTNLDADNISGSIANANHANDAKYVSACSQPNITSVGTLTSLNVSGVSTLDDVQVSGNLLTANITSNTFVKTPDLILGDASNTVSRIAFYSDESTTPFWLTNTGSGNLRISYGEVPTISNYVKFSTNGDVNASGNINASAFGGDGSQLININASNITGSIANATHAVNANVAKYVSENAQSNITSVGTLTGLRVNGRIEVGNQSINYGKYSTTDNSASIVLGSEQRTAPANQKLFGIAHYSDGSVAFRNDNESGNNLPVQVFTKSAYSGSQTIQFLPNGNLQLEISSTGLDIASSIRVTNNGHYGGNITANGNIRSEQTVFASNFNGNLTGVASEAIKLKTARKINGVNFDGTSDIEIPGNYVFKSGFSYVSDWSSQTTGFGPSTKNFFDVFPPDGFVMNNLVAFVAGIGEIYFAGGVDSNDSLRCRPYYLSDRVRVYVNNSEQRARPGANWMAIWSQFNSQIGGNYYEDIITSPIPNEDSTTTSLNSNFAGGEIVYSGVLTSTASVTFNSNGSIGVSGVGRKYSDTLSSKSWSFPESSNALGSKYWIKARIVTVTGSGNYQFSGSTGVWQSLSTSKTWSLTYSDSELTQPDSCTILLEISISSDQKGVNILSVGNITLMADI